MLYVLETENMEQESAETVESSLVAEESKETETSAITEQPKEWPGKGVESFTDYALPTLVFGMLGIFVVLGLISLATIALNKLFPGKKN